MSEFNAIIPFDASKKKFELGDIYLTASIEEWADMKEAKEKTLGSLLTRHSQGDWGDISSRDKKANDLALRQGSRLHSVYNVAGKRVWIITEADRSVTTLLFPEDY